jgi:translation initiation factor IF-3
MRQVNEFLDEGDDVTLIMKLRGREKAHFNVAEEKINDIIKLTENHGKEVARKKTEGLIIVRLIKASSVNKDEVKIENNHVIENKQPEVK